MPINPSQMTSETTLLGQTPRETSLSSEGIRQSWDERLKEHSVFSARTTSQKYLDMVKKRLAEVASRQITPQKAEEMLRRTLQDLGYRPETGFPDARGAVPPATPGDIRDLSSSRRIQLILDTNVKQARSLGQIAASEDPMTLLMTPAWELTRMGARKKPRGDWNRRWAAAGAKCGWKGAARKRMAALKTSPIWQALADGTGGFRDTLGSPYPPFAFGSGLAWAGIGRSEWKRICAAEGIKDGLEDVTAKAKKLKAAKRGAGGSVAAPSGAGMSTPLPSTARPAGRGSGLLGNPSAGMGRTVRTPPPATPRTERVAGAFRANLRSRLATDDVIDEALNELQGMRDAAGRSLAEIDEAQAACRKSVGADPRGDAKAALDSFAERKRLAGDAKAELNGLWGRIVNYGSAVGSTPVPRNAEEQESFDETMARYRTAAERTVREARAQSMRIGLAADAARKTAERVGAMQTPDPAEEWRRMWSATLLERAKRTMDSLDPRPLDIAAETARAEEEAGARLPEDSEAAKRLEDARKAYAAAKENAETLFAGVEKRCKANDVDGAGVAMARFANAADYCRRKDAQVRSALSAFREALARSVQAERT